MLSIPRGVYRGVAPFLIQDETPREERVPRQTRHANGVTGIGTVTVAVDDVGRVAGWYTKVLGKPGQRIVSEELRGTGQRFVIGPHTLDFVAPDAASSPLKSWLATRGASPYAATLSTPGARGGLLDESKTLGARLALA